MASPVDPIISAYISGESGVITDITTRLTALNALISNYQTSQQQLSLAQQSVQNLTQQLTAVQLDDSSAQSHVVALTKQIQGMFSPMDVLTGKVTLAIFAALQTHKRSPQVVGTTINQDQEIMLQWGDPGGTKADNNPNTVVKPHGAAVFIPGTAITPAHLAFNPAAVGDNEYLFMGLTTPAVPPILFYSSRTYQCTAAEFAALICPEADSQITWAGWVYNFGIQGNPAGWRFYKYGNPGDWVLIEPVIPVPDFVSAPMKFDTMSTIDTVAHTVTRLAIRINNGPWIPVNMTLPAYNSGGGNKYTCAVQLDPKGTTPTGMTVIDAEERCLTVTP